MHPDNDITGESDKHELHMNCPHCQQVIAVSESVTSDWGDEVCESCANDFSTCEDCGEIVLKTSLVHSGLTGKYYCDNCYSERFTTCIGCDEEISRSSCYTNRHGDTYCCDCYHDRYVECNACSCELERDDADYNEEDDNYYCCDCNREHSVVKDYSYVPRFTNYATTGEKKNKLFFGIELEVETKENYNTQAKKLQEYMEANNIDKNFYMKWDGSVDGFEIVSHPFTSQYAHKKLGFYSMLKWLKKNKFTSYKSGRCGLHIHMSRSFFSDNDVRKLRLFFSINRKELEKFACRHNKNTNFCQFMEYNVNDFKFHKQEESERYVALNLSSSKHTIEVRIFRGTLHHERLLASIQFCDAVAHFVKEVGCTGLTRNSWDIFLDWCAFKNRYGHFVKYINAKRILEGKRVKKNVDPDEEVVAPEIPIFNPTALDNALSNTVTVREDIEPITVNCQDMSRFAEMNSVYLGVNE